MGLQRKNSRDRKQASREKIVETENRPLEKKNNRHRQWASREKIVETENGPLEKNGCY